MLLDRIVDVIETLRTRIRDHRSTLVHNELRTRGSLIDPLLQVLGWDKSNPSLVKLDYNVNNFRVDYALLGSDGRPAVFVKVKRLGEALTPHLFQILGYANIAGVPFVALTNGDGWELYKVFDQAPIDNRCIVKTRLSRNRSRYETALKLLALSNFNIANENQVKAPTPGFSEQGQPGISKPVQPIVPAIGKPPGGGWGVFPNGPTADWMRLSDIDESDKKGIDRMPTPSKLRLPDNGTKRISSWRDILVFTADWLLSRKVVPSRDIPLSLGNSNKRYLINRQPVHGTGREFHAQRRMENGYYILTNFTKAESIAHTKQLLERFGHEAHEVSLRFPKRYE